MYKPYFFDNLLKIVPRFENMSIFCYNSIPWGKAEVVVGGSKLRLKYQYKEVHFTVGGYVRLNPLMILKLYVCF